MRKSATLLLIFALTASLIAVEVAPASASMPKLHVPSKPSVPYFTLTLGAYVKDIPPTYSVNPYTGENVTVSSGSQVEVKYVNLSIRNSKFTHYQDSNDEDVNLYYIVRVKGHYEDRWTELPRVTATDSAYTELRYDLGQFGSYQTFQSVPVDGELDFQVAALLGYYTTVYQTLLPIGEDFYGETSGWSKTQTLTIESQTTTPSPTATPATTPTPQEEPQQIDQELIIGVAVIVAVIGAGLGLLIYLIKRK